MIHDLELRELPMRGKGVTFSLRFKLDGMRWRQDKTIPERIVVESDSPDAMALRVLAAMISVVADEVEAVGSGPARDAK